MATKSTTKKVKVEDLKTCLICDSEMKSDKFYKHRNKLISDKYSICKNCAIREANKSVEDMHNILRILDISFIPELYKECEGKENPFGHYLLLMGNPKKRFDNGKLYSELTYSDSPTCQQVTDIDNYIFANNEKLGELYSLFGTTWSKEELLAMNKELDDMLVQYGGSRDNLSTLDLYSEIIQTKWLSKRAYNSNDIANGEKLSKLRQKLLKDNGLTLQDMKDKNNNEALGQKIDLAEDRPIVPNKKYYDIDGIWYMFQKLIKHMERFRSIDKSSVDEDYEEMQEYVDNHPHYSNEME